MATAEQIKSLIKAHFDHDEERFRTVVLQIAAYEAKHGHEPLAREIKKLADKPASKNNILHLNSQNPMLFMSVPAFRMSELIVTAEISERIQRIINEYRNRNKLGQYGLSNRRKILIEGKPGTGKTFTAAVIASELELPLYTVQMDKLVTKFMGETSVKLRQIFDSIDSSTGVYFFDEFDAIGADRNFDNEVGEMRRVLSSFLQFIEQDASDSIIIAATNNRRLLDQALFRRFDDVLQYSLPSEDEVRRLFALKLDIINSKFHLSKKTIEMATTLSHAEIIGICNDAIKDQILNGKTVDEKVIVRLISERLASYSSKEA